MAPQSQNDIEERQGGLTVAQRNRNRKKEKAATAKNEAGRNGGGDEVRGTPVAVNPSAAQRKRNQKKEKAANTRNETGKNGGEKEVRRAPVVRNRTEWAATQRRGRKGRKGGRE